MKGVAARVGWRGCSLSSAGHCLCPVGGTRCYFFLGVLSCCPVPTTPARSAHSTQPHPPGCVGPLPGVARGAPAPARQLLAVPAAHGALGLPEHLAGQRPKHAGGPGLLRPSPTRQHMRSRQASWPQLVPACGCQCAVVTVRSSHWVEYVDADKKVSSVVASCPPKRPRRLRLRLAPCLLPLRCPGAGHAPRGAHHQPAAARGPPLAPALHGPLAGRRAGQPGGPRRGCAGRLAGGGAAGGRPAGTGVHLWRAAARQPRLCAGLPGYCAALL